MTTQRPPPALRVPHPFFATKLFDCSCDDGDDGDDDRRWLPGGGRGPRPRQPATTTTKASGLPGGTTERTVGARGVGGRGHVPPLTCHLLLVSRPSPLLQPTLRQRRDGARGEHGERGMRGAIGM